MAEGGFDPSFNRQKTQLCRYYMHGACRRGNDCKFIHSRDGTAPLNNICKYYQLGKCTYGQNCRYDHVKPSSTSLTNRQDQRESWGQKPDRFERRNGERESNMVVLKKEGLEKSLADATNNRRQQAFEEKWVKASDFVPGQKYHKNRTYANTAKTETTTAGNSEAQLLPPDPVDKDLLCPYYAHGNCPYEDKCPYVHGDMCDMCNFPRLHPANKALREAHRKECMAELEKDMELSFAVHESKDKECCICLEMVLEKASTKSTNTRFGILENCNHCFCLSCIRRWRSDKSFGKNVRVCPICRVHSDFVTPSKFWVEDEEKKKQLIQDYKEALRNKPCHYFKQGKGECPFNEKCFYRHAYPDGTIAQPKPRKRRRRLDANGDETLMDSLSLWSFLDNRDSTDLSLDDELSMLVSLVLTQNSDDDIDYWDLYDTTSESDSDIDWGF